MTIDHRDIPNGEMHSPYNWIVSSLETRPTDVSYEDVGKLCWVQGSGSFILANSDPVSWEVSSATIDSFAYDSGTKVLTITDSTGVTYTATIDGQNAAQVAAFIAAHAAAADPHDDRAYSDAALSAYALTVTSALSGKQAADATLTALAGLNTTSGFVVQVGVDNFTKRTLTGTAGQIAITNGAGDTGIPTFSLAASGVVAGTYGSASAIPIPVIDTYGRITGITTVAPSAAFSDSALRIQDNSDATKQLALEVSGIATGTTRTWTAPNAAINFGDLPAIATTNGNVLSGTRTRILGGSSNTVSGTDNQAIECTGLTLNGDVACSNIVAVGVHNTFNASGSWPFPKSTVVLGSSTAPNVLLVDSYFGAALGGETCLYTGKVAVSATVTDITASGAVAASNSNSLKAVAGTTAQGAATHDIEFMIAVGTDNGAGSVVTRRTVFERRKVYVCRDQAGTMTSSTITPETAVTLGDAATGTVTVGVTVDTTNNRIVPTVTGVSGANQTHYQASVRVKSHYNRK